MNHLLTELFKSFDPKRQQLEKEIIRLEKKLQDYNIVRDGLNRFIMNPDNEITVKDSCQLYAIEQNIKSYENELASKEVELYLYDNKLTVLN